MKDKMKSADDIRATEWLADRIHRINTGEGNHEDAPVSIQINVALSPEEYRRVIHINDRAARQTAVLVLAVLLPLATQAAPEESRPYSALETLRRAQVGTHSPRLAPPARVTPAEPLSRRPETSRFERMDCRPDPSRLLERAILCTPTEPGKAN